MGAIRATTAAVLILAFAAVAAADCVTDARQISSRTAVPNLTAGPSAWSGFGLAVAKTQAGDPDAIWIAIYDEMLQTLVPDVKVADDAADASAIIDLVWNGLEYGLFYRATDAIHLQRLSIGGEPLGPPAEVDPTRLPRFNQDIEVEWSDALNGWALARSITSGSRRGLWVVILERDGSLRSEHFIGSLPEATPFIELAVTESGVIGLFNVTSDGQVLHFTRVVEGNLFPETKTIAPSGENVQVTAAGERFVVTRSVGNDIRWMVIDNNGGTVRADALLVPAEGDVLVPLALEAANGELALTYAHSASTNELDMRLRRFRIDGTLVSDTHFTASELRARFAFSTHPPQWTGTSWLIAAARNSAASGDSWIARYCPLVVSITGSHTARVGVPLTLSSIVDGGVPEYEYQWSFSRNPGGPSRSASVTRTFTSPGPSIATVVVTDRSGATATSQFLINVTNQPDPEPEPPPKKRRSVRK